MSIRRTSSFASKNTKTVLFSQSRTTLQNAFFGISLVNFTWEAGKRVNQEKARSMGRDLRSFPRSISIKVSSSMVKKMALAFSNSPMVIFTMDSGSMASKTEEESTSMLLPV
jgi:hypothetical protein